MKINNLRIWFFIPPLIFIVIVILSYFYYQQDMHFSNKDGHFIPAEKYTDYSWKINLNDNLLYSPMIAEDLIFIQTEHFIQGININSKKVTWKNNIESSINNCPPYTNGKFIAVSNNKNEIQLFDNYTGSLIWTSEMNKLKKYSKGASILDIKIQGNTVVVARFSDKYYFLDISTGRVIEHFYAPDRDSLAILLFNEKTLLINSTEIRLINLTDESQTRSITGNFKPRSAIIRDEILYIISTQKEENSIVLFDLGTGREFNQISTNISDVSCITITDKNIIVSGNGIESFALSNYQKEWSNSQINNLSCPIVIGEEIIVRRIGSDLFSLNLISGQYISRHQITGAKIYNFQNIFGPLLLNGDIIVPTSNTSIGGVKISGQTDQ